MPFWTCTKCNFYNDADDYICVECGHNNLYHINKPTVQEEFAVSDIPDVDIPDTIGDETLFDDPDIQQPIELEFDTQQYGSDDFIADTGINDDDIHHKPLYSDVTSNISDNEPIPVTLDNEDNDTYIEPLMMSERSMSTFSVPGIYIELEEHIQRQSEQQIKRRGRFCLGIINNPLVFLMSIVVASSLGLYFYAHEKFRTTESMLYHYLQFLCIVFYIVYIIVFFPLFDRYMCGIRGDPICHNLWYSLSTIDDPSTPSDALQSLLPIIFTPHVISVVNTEPVPVDVIPSPSSEGVDLLQLLSTLSSTVSRYIFLSIRLNVNFESGKKAAITDHIIQAATGDTLLLHTNKLSVNYGISSRTLSFILSPNLDSEHNSSSTQYNDKSIIEDRFDSLDENMTHIQTSKPSKTKKSSSSSKPLSFYLHSTLLWLFHNRVIHLLSYLCLLEWLYLCIWHTLLRTVNLDVTYTWHTRPSRTSHLHEYSFTGPIEGIDEVMYNTVNNPSNTSGTMPSSSRSNLINSSSSNNTVGVSWAGEPIIVTGTASPSLSQYNHSENIEPSSIPRYKFTSAAK